MRNTATMARQALLMGMLSLSSGAARADSYGVGNISGTITFPGETVPALRVYAFNTDGRAMQVIETPRNETKFTLKDLPVGQYHVVAFPFEKEGNFEAVAWTHAAHCIKGPCDHSLVVVNVAAASTANGVLLSDWYVPPGILPVDPAAAREKAAIALDCEKEKTPVARDTCHQRAHEAADKAVNKHFERVMRALEKYPKCHEELRSAQLAWLRFRDQQCTFEGSMSQKGRTVRCLRELTEARANYLQGQTPLGCNR
ncbi:MAG TPA: lysozyme inhibitor LprI family protein [Polyangia bacterium]|nr:lysozyme inhibitor LprI family protein [Polyangia bacterium]